MPFYTMKAFGFSYLSQQKTQLHFLKTDHFYPVFSFKKITHIFFLHKKV